MACEHTIQCDLAYGVMKCGLPEDTVDVDLKVCTLKGIHTFKRHYKSQKFRVQSMGSQRKPYPGLCRKMVEFM